jgi:hypothetical protein
MIFFIAVKKNAMKILLPAKAQKHRLEISMQKLECGHESPNRAFYPAGFASSRLAWCRWS